NSMTRWRRPDADGNARVPRRTALLPRIRPRGPWGGRRSSEKIAEDRAFDPEGAGPAQRCVGGEPETLTRSGPTRPDIDWDCSGAARAVRLDSRQPSPPRCPCG